MNSPIWFVYRLTDADGVVFYVGMTRHFDARMSQHYCADYGDRIDTVGIERFADEAEAAAREMGLIAELSPDLNVVGVTAEDPPDPERGTCNKCGFTTDHGNAMLCDGCCSEALAEYLADGPADGPTLRELSGEYGVTHERLRQRFNEMCGMPASLIRRAYRVEATELAAERFEQQRIVDAELAGVTCSTCGRPHARRHGGKWSANCSSECSEMWQEVRYLTDDYKQAHRERMASWFLRHPSQVDQPKVTFALKVHAGDGPTYEDNWSDRDRRWLQPGSKRWHIAVRAYREGWPSFDTWSTAIQEQVREHVDAERAVAS